MKYLLAAIDARRGAVRLDDAELRKLLSDVRRAKDERAEMAEAMDRLLTELRGSEHSQAFNSKVSKRDAPDYADVVKNPMDLGTMQRNVRAGKYRTKAAFSRDLELIWSNCELYNSVGHVLRRSAAIMRAKARHLLAYVHEGDEVGEALRMWEKRSDAVTAAAGIGAGGKGKGKGTEDASTGPNLSRLPLSLPLIPQPRSSLTASSALALPLAERPALTRSASDMARFLQLESMGLPRNDASGSNSSMRQREESLMLFKLAEEEGKSGTAPGSLTLALGAAPKGASVDVIAQGDEAWWSLSSSTFLTSGVSGTSASVRLPFREEDNARRRVVGTSFGGRPAIRRNIKTISQLRHTTSKFVALSNHTDTESPLPAWLATTSSDEEDNSDEEEAPVRSSSPRVESKVSRRRRAAGPPPLQAEGENPFARVNASGARQGLSHAAKTSLAHSGFDGVNASCLNVVTDIAGEYLENLGRTLRMYADRYASEMSVEELVLHTLRENGGASVASLETYVVDEVERYGGRLEDMLRRNRAAYRERLNSSIVPMADEAFFQAGNDALVSGGFAEHLGDDFFGFKAMGLDAETGMAGLTVPARLFKAKTSAVSRSAALDGASDEAKVAFPPPPPNVRVSESSVGAQIGLLQPWYRETLRTRGRWRSFAINSEDERAERAVHAQARAAARPRSRSRMLSASVAPPESSTSEAGEVVLSDDEQERQRFKVGPTGRLPKREMAPALKVTQKSLGPKKRARAA